jgi:hypothetical protein
MIAWRAPVQGIALTGARTVLPQIRLLRNIALRTRKFSTALAFLAQAKADAPTVILAETPISDWTGFE